MMFLFGIHADYIPHINVKHALTLLQRDTDENE